MGHLKNTRSVAEGNNGDRVLSDEEKTFDMAVERKRVIVNLLGLIVTILAAILFLYFQFYFARTYKILGVSIGLLLFGSLLNFLGKSLILMNKYEIKKRTLEHGEVLPGRAFGKKILMMTIIAVIVSALIIWFSYL